MFTTENASKYGRLGGLGKGEHGFKQQAKEWVREFGFNKLVSWVNGKNDRKSTFAAGLLFSYALGKPAEKIQIDDRKEIYIQLSKDPELNAIAQRFGINPIRLLESSNGVMVDGESEIQTKGAATPSL